MIQSIKTVYIINDYFQHGGHVKSFVTQFKEINPKNFIIICSTNGYILENRNNLEIPKDKIITINMSKLRRIQFNYKLYTIIKNNLEEGDRLNIYSIECYFSSLLAKSFFDNVSILNFVMAGPEPFPMLKSTDIYIAVSKEQKDYVLKNTYNKNIDENKVKIIKNRIKPSITNINRESKERYVLVVSRFDKGLKASLDRILFIIQGLDKKIPIKIAGTGEILETYKKYLKDFKNIEFLGYRDDINDLRINACVVLGMGRSILESLLIGKPSILIGHNGVELLEDINYVSFASDYNFSGRKIKNDLDLNITVSKIEDYYETNYTLKQEIIDFITSEYSIDYFAEKYTILCKEVKSTNVTVYQILEEYIYIFLTRVKRKINSLLWRNK